MMIVSAEMFLEDLNSYIIPNDLAVQHARRMVALIKLLGDGVSDLLPP
jgi:hypothetical protein